MATLIAVYKTDGRCIGRCDAKCYNATCVACNCICGGANHGCGEQQAIANTSEMVESWIEDWKQSHPEDDFSFKKADLQQDLWGEWSVKRKTA